MLDIDFEKFKNLSGKDLYSKIFYEIGAQNKEVLMLGSDAIDSNGGGQFRENFPKRTFDFGIAEANMVSAAAGLAKLNKIPLVGMYGFLVLRTAEQIRDDVCYQNLNVKIFGTHTGVSFPDGGVTHHGTEDISILRTFPNIVIIQPASPKEAISAIYTSVLDYNGPVYLRLSPAINEEIYDNTFNFQIGKAFTLQNGKDITLIASGITVSIAKEASNRLSDEGIDVRLIDIPTIKPIDKKVIEKAAKETQGIITIEDGTIAGGLGAEVTQIVCESYPTKVKMLGFPKDRFTVIGPSVKVLFDYFGIKQENIIKAAREILS